MKLNTSRSFSSDLQVIAGVGGLVRVPSGELLFGFFTPLQAASSFGTEFQSLLHKFHLAVQHAYRIWVERDAVLVISMLMSNRGGSAITHHTLSSIYSISL